MIVSQVNIYILSVHSYYIYIFIIPFIHMQYLYILCILRMLALLEVTLQAVMISLSVQILILYYEIIL